MKIKLTIIAVLMLVFTGLSVKSASAAFCPTSNPSTGVGCTLDNYNYFCNGACQLNSLVPSCGTWTPTPVIAPNYATTTTTGLRGVSTAACTAADACGVCTTCSGGYPNKCGTYPNVFCKANFTPTSGDTGYVTNCTDYNDCAETCSTCAGGYALCSAQNKCTQIISCLPGQTFNNCTGVCDGAAAILKLGVDSVSGTNLIQSASASYSTLFISQLNRVGIGTSTPSTYLQFGGSGQTVNMSGTRIGGLDLTPLSADEAVPLGYLQANYAPVSSAFWTGSSTGHIYNLNSGNVGIGTTSPSHKLSVMGSGYFLGDNSVPNAPVDLGFYLGKSLTDENRRMEIVSPSGGAAYIDFTQPNADFKGRIIYWNSANRFEFSTNATTRMSIDGSGNVGIGTTSPVSLFNAISGVSDFRYSTGASAVTPTMSVINTNASGKAAALLAGTSGSAFEYDNSGYFDIASNAKSAFTGNTNGVGGTSRLRIGSTGNVGIGTTTSAVKLQVSGGTGIVLSVAGGRISDLDLVPLASSDAVPLGYLQSNYTPSSSNLWNGSRNGNIWNGDSGAGNVGIGTSTPAAKLHVSSVSPELRIDDIGNNYNSGNVQSVLSFYGRWFSGKASPDTTGAIKILKDNVDTLGGSAMSFFVQDNNQTTISEKMRINKLGYVGIGTTNPGTKLDVVGGSIRTDGQLISTVGYGTAPLSVISTTTVTNLSANYLGFGSVGATPSSSPYAKLTAGIITLPEFNNSEAGTITIRGWNASYYSWQLIGNNTPWNRAELYFRTGPEGSWGTAYKLWHSGNLTTGLVTSTIPKWNGSSLSNSLIYDNGSSLGIGTNSPSVKFQISGVTGQAINVSGGRIGGLDLTPLSSDEAVPLGYLQANYFTAASSTAGITSIYLTATTYNGSFVNSTYTGYDAGNKICAALVSGSHFCRTDEIVYLIQKNGAVGFSSINGENAWMADGPPGFTGAVAADDCGGWTDATNNKLGHFWMFSSSGGGRGSLSSCDTMKKIACCK